MDMNTHLRDLHAERRARQGLPYRNAFLREVHAERRARQGLSAPPIQGYDGCGRGRTRSRSRERCDRGRGCRDDSSSRSPSRGIEAPAPAEPPAQDMALDEPPPPPADADDGSVRAPDEVVVEQLVDDAELAVPPLMTPDQADQRFEEAVAIAVEKCAADTAGQRCYICLEAVDPDTNEGLVRGCACRGGEGVAHVSCLARGAQVAVQRGVQNGWSRWYTCGLCKQGYHGVVRCALGWACWKTYVGRPEAHWTRLSAMRQLGNGLSDARHHEDALSVREAELSMRRRFGAPEEIMLNVQGNFAATYQALGRYEQALQMKRAVYSGHLRLSGEEHRSTIIAANNYASSLNGLRRFGEAKSLFRKVIPVARRVVGESNEFTLGMRMNYAKSLYTDAGATLDDLREAATTLEETAPIARRVLGGAHPVARNIERSLQIYARMALMDREFCEENNFSAQDLDAAKAAAVSNRGDQAGAAADPDAELKAEIAALEAQLTETRHELSRRTGTPQDQAPPPPTGSFPIGTSSPPARGRAGRRIVRARRPPPRELGYTT